VSTNSIIISKLSRSSSPSSKSSLTSLTQQLKNPITSHSNLPSEVKDFLTDALNLDEFSLSSASAKSLSMAFNPKTKISVSLQKNLHDLNKISLEDPNQAADNLKYVFHQLVEAYDRLNAVYLENEGLRRALEVKAKEKEDTHKQMHSMRLNFKQIKRNLVAQAKREERNRAEKEVES
jgi:regulator of replication initiation timing